MHITNSKKRVCKDCILFHCNYITFWKNKTIKRSIYSRRQWKDQWLSDIGGRRTDRAQRAFRAVKIPQWWIHVTHFSNLQNVHMYTHIISHQGMQIKPQWDTTSYPLHHEGRSGSRKTETYYTASKWCSCYGTVWWSFQWLNTDLACDLATVLFGIYPREMQTYVHKKTCKQYSSEQHYS